MTHSAQLITDYFACEAARQRYGSGASAPLMASIWHFKTEKLRVTWHEGRVHEICSAAFRSGAFDTARARQGLAAMGSVT